MYARTRDARSFAALLGAVLALCAPELTKAQWVANGNPICTATDDQYGVAITADALGGAVMVWADNRTSSASDIFARRVDQHGTGLWAPDGIALCTTSGTQSAPRVGHDNGGQFYYVWQDARTDTGDIFGAVTDGSGNVLTTPNGYPLGVATGGQRAPSLAVDPDHEIAIAAWIDARSGTDDVYAQVFTSGGRLGQANGFRVCNSSAARTVPAVATEGDGTAIIVWQDARSGPNPDIYAQKVSLSGVLLWDPPGMPVCTHPAAQLSPMIVSDGAGGAIVAWEDRRNSSTHTDLYAQHIDASGAMLWAANGVPIRVAADLMLLPKMIPDGQGGAILAWEDDRNSTTTGPDIYAQRIDGSGNRLWLANGVAVCPAPFAQTNVDLVSDGVGGVVITWQDVRTVAGTFDVYAQHLDDFGGAWWPANGVAVCTESHNQFFPVIVADGLGGTIIAWEDRRNSGFALINDVFASRLENSVGRLGHPEPLLLSVNDVPDDNGGFVRATFREGDGGPFTDFQIERATVPPSFVPIASVGGGGGPNYSADIQTTADLVDNTFRVIATTPQSQQFASNWITAQSMNNHVCPGSVLLDTANGAALASPGALYTLQAPTQNWGVLTTWSPPLSPDWTLQVFSTGFAPPPTCFSNMLASAPLAPVTYLAADLRWTPGATYGVDAQTAVPATTGALRWMTPTDLAVDGYVFDWTGTLNVASPIRVFRVYLYAGTRQDVYYTSSAPQPSWLRVFRNSTPGNAWFSTGSALLEVQGTPASPVTPASFFVPTNDWYLLVTSMSTNPVVPDDAVEVRGCGFPILLTQQSVLKPPQSISGFPWKFEFEQTAAQSGALAWRVEAPALGPAHVLVGTPEPGCGLTVAQAECWAEYGKVGVLSANLAPGGLATGRYRAVVFHVYNNPIPIRMEWDAGLGTISLDGPPTTRSFAATDIVDAWDVVLQSGTTYYFEFAATGSLDARLCLSKGTGWDGRGSAPGDPLPALETNGMPYASYIATRSGPHTLYVVNDNGGSGTYSFRVTTIPAGGAWADTPGDAQAIIVYGPPPPAASAGSGSSKAPTLAYVADGAAGVTVVDVSAPSNPTVLGAVPGFQGDALDIRSRGARAVVTGTSQLTSIDLGSGAVDGTFPDFGFSAADIDATGRVIAVAFNRIDLLDWTYPEFPSLLGEFDVDGDSRRVTFASPVADRAYVADGFGGQLWIVDTRPGRIPSIMTSIELPGDANDVEVAGQYAYVACGSAGLAIVQLGGSNSVISTFDTHGYATGVTVDGGRAYVTNGSDGLAVVDVSSPTSPQPVSFLETGGTANHVIVANGRVFVADGASGLLVLNQPTIATGVPSPEPGPVSGSPTVYALSAYPNPLIGRATLSLATPRATPVVLDVFDLAGRRVRRVFEGIVQPGVHPFAWDGSDGNGRRVAAGVYIVRAGGPQLQLTRRVVVLR